MTTTVHIYYHGEHGKLTDTVYKHVSAILAGPAVQVLGAEAEANGIPRTASLIRLVMDNGETATYDADHITMLFD